MLEFQFVSLYFWFVWALALQVYCRSSLGNRECRDKCILGDERKYHLKTERKYRNKTISSKFTDLPYSNSGEILLMDFKFTNLPNFVTGSISSVNTTYISSLIYSPLHFRPLIYLHNVQRQCFQKHEDVRPLELPSQDNHRGWTDIRGPAFSIRQTYEFSASRHRRGSHHKEKLPGVS